MSGKAGDKDKMVVVGDGGWGSAVALALVRAGHRVTLWGYDPEYLDDMARRRENTRFLPGVALPGSLDFNADLAAALAGARLAFVAVPTQFLRRTLARHWPPEARARRPGLVSLTKGVEIGGLARPSEILAELAGRERLAVLSGPSHAEEVAAGRPTTLVAASDDRDFAGEVQRACTGGGLRVYTSDDMVGVELAAAVKNVIALAAGMAAGLELGDNALAALVTRGIAEMTRLGVAAGARPATFAGLAGMGDAIVTCYSAHGRNRAVGIELGRGRRLADILAERRTVAEGIGSAESVRELARRLAVEMPITEQVCRVLFEDKPPRAAVVELMARDPRPEHG